MSQYKVISDKCGALCAEKFVGEIITSDEIKEGCGLETVDCKDRRLGTFNDGYRLCLRKLSEDNVIQKIKEV